MLYYPPYGRRLNAGLGRRNSRPGASEDASAVSSFSISSGEDSARSSVVSSASADCSTPGTSIPPCSEASSLSRVNAGRISKYVVQNTTIHERASIHFFLSFMLVSSVVISCFIFVLFFIGPLFSAIAQPNTNRVWSTVLNDLRIWRLQAP